MSPPFQSPDAVSAAVNVSARSCESLGHPAGVAHSTETWSFLSLSEPKTLWRGTSEVFVVFVFDPYDVGFDSRYSGIVGG